MNKALKIILFPALLILLSMHCTAQDCKDFIKSKDCYVYIPLNRHFEIYNQARSTYVEMGKTNVFKVVLFGKKDFIVGVCAGDKFYRRIWLRILDSNTKQVLYDNKDYDYIESFMFTIDKTQPLDLVITVLPTGKMPPGTKVCLGIQILSSNTVPKK